MSTALLALDTLGHLHASTHAITAFLADGPIQIDSQPPPGSNGFIRLLGWARWMFTVFAVLALIIAGGKFGFEKFSHNELQSPKMVAGVIAGCIVVAAAPQIVYIAGTA